MLSLISECSLQSTEKRSNRLQKSTPKVNLDEHSETGNYKYSGEEQKTREYYNTLSSHYGVEQFEIYPGSQHCCYYPYRNAVPAKWKMSSKKLWQLQNFRSLNKKTERILGVLRAVSVTVCIFSVSAVYFMTNAFSFVFLTPGCFLSGPGARGTVPHAAPGARAHRHATRAQPTVPRGKTLELFNRVPKFYTTTCS